MPRPFFIDCEKLMTNLSFTLNSLSQFDDWMITKIKVSEPKRELDTPGWWSYQPQNNYPETNILAEAQDALKNAFLFRRIVPNMKCHTL